jgi:hypothetical protein
MTLYHLPETMYESVESVDQPGTKLVDMFPDGIYFIVNDTTNEIEGVFKALPHERPAKGIKIDAAS